MRVCWRGVVGWVSPIVVAAAALAPASAHAAPLPAEIATKIDRVFARWDRRDSPGAIVAIARDGETVFARGYGMANLEHGIALTPDTLSETGSVAKQFTAAAVTLLAVRGKVSLDDSLRKHLPEVPEFCRDITLRMLLDHTSGLRDIHGLFELMGRPTYTSPHENAEVLEVVRRQRALNFPPGTEYSYSNTGYLLLTFVIARVSGRPFVEFCAENVFRPRGMTHTAWRTDFTSVVRGRASAYSEGRDGGFRVNMPHSNIHGNGGLLTTVGDLLRWNESFVAPTGEWAEVARLMHTPSKLKNGQPIENGLGLRLERYQGVPEVSHSGGTAGYATFLARYPEQHLSIAVLGNCLGLDGGAHVRRLADILLAPDLAPMPPRVPHGLTPAGIQVHTGLYRDAAADLLVRVNVVGGKLWVNGIEVTPSGPHTFFAPALGTEYRFEVDATGMPQRLTFASNRITRTYTVVPAATPNSAGAEFTGTYFSAELDVSIPVVARAGVLTVQFPPGISVRAEPTLADGFWLGRAWHVMFVREASGQVTGFEITNALSRCRRVLFTRR